MLAGARARVAATNQEARDRAAAAKRGEAEFGAALRASIRDAERAARAEVRSANVAAAERIRIATRVASEERRLRAEVARSGDARSSVASSPHARLALLQSVKRAPAHEQKAALEKVADLHVADVGAKAEEKSAQKTAAEKIRQMRMVDREAAKGRAIGVRESEKAEAEKNRSAMKWVKQREREIAQRSNERRERYSKAILGGGVEAGRTLVKGATSLAGRALDLGGGLQIQDVLHERLNLERQAALLSNTTSQGAGTRIDKKQILGDVRAASIASHTDESDLMAGSNAYFAKASSYAGKDQLAFYGKVAKATGTKLEDLMTEAGAMKVQNKNLSDDDLKQLTLSTVMQSRKGSVEFKDMAQAGAKITRSAVGYSGDQAQLQSELLGLSQIGMRTEGNNVSAAATDLSNVQGDAVKHRVKIRALLGHDFLNDKGQINDGPSQFMAELLAKSGGNLTKLADAGMGKQSMKMLQALAPTFNDAQAGALKEGKTKEQANAVGKAAVLADIKDVSAGKYDEKDLDNDFAEVMSTSAEKFEDAVRVLKAEVADKLVPALVPLIGVIQRATPVVGDLLTKLVAIIEWAERNPFEAAFAGLGLSIAKTMGEEIIKAKVGDLLKSLLSGGGGGGLPIPGGAPGGGVGTLGGGLAVVTAGVVAGYETKKWVDQGFEDETKKDDARRQRLVEANNLAGAAKHGKLTPEQQARARELTSQLQGDSQQEASELDPDNVSTVKKVTGAFGALLGGDEFAQTQQDEQAQLMKSQQDTVKTMAELTKALQANTVATTSNTTTTKGDSGGAPATGGGPSSPHPNRYAPIGARNTGGQSGM